MYIYYNAHPKGKIVDDCVKRAISKAETRDYKEVSRDLNKLKKITGAISYNRGNNTQKYLEKYKQIYNFNQKDNSYINGERFCELYPQGNYILKMAGHMSCCIDGIIYDTWDCSKNRVYFAYEVK